MKLNGYLAVILRAFRKCKGTIEVVFSCSTRLMIIGLDYDATRVLFRGPEKMKRRFFQADQ